MLAIFEVTVCYLRFSADVSHVYQMREVVRFELCIEDNIADSEVF